MIVYELTDKTAVKSEIDFPFCFTSACGSNPLVIGGKAGTFGIKQTQAETYLRCSWNVHVEVNKVSNTNTLFVTNSSNELHLHKRLYCSALLSTQFA